MPRFPPKKLILCLGLAVSAMAQERNEIGFSIGATLTPNQSLTLAAIQTSLPVGIKSFNFDPSFAFVVDYYRALTMFNSVAIYAGASVAVSPLDVMTNSGPSAGPKQYAYLFLTPEIRVKFNPRGSVSPWVAFGGGYANFLEGSLINGSPNPNAGSSGGALQFAGGIDVGTPFSLPFLKLPIRGRIAIRDYYSSLPNYRVPVTGDMQHNVILAAGIVLVH